MVGNAPTATAPSAAPNLPPGFGSQPSASSGVFYQSPTGLVKMQDSRPGQKMGGLKKGFMTAGMAGTNMVRTLPGSAASLIVSPNPTFLVPTNDAMIVRLEVKKGERELKVTGGGSWARDTGHQKARPSM
jgi:hypothetical protein